MKNLFIQLIRFMLHKALRGSIAPACEYKNYEEAIAACQNGTYQNDELVKVIVDKNVAYKQQLQMDTIFDLGTLRILIAVGLSKSDNSLNVLDFGGGGGYHYTIASIAFKDIPCLKWNVVETTAMANEAQRVANKKLNFFDNVADAAVDLGRVDLVFTSGALQYCPSPLAALKQLTEVNAKYLFITRTAFTETEVDLFTTQTSYLSVNGPGPLPEEYVDREIKYPVTYASKSKAEEILKERYHIQFLIIEDKGAYRIGSTEVDMFGYFCVRKN
jgi:putative methyltransferase (TIGR04325 family)